MQTYSERIKQLSAFNPRHVEAYMRVERNTLDGLSARQFASEVRFAEECIREGGGELAERIAKSFGL